MRNLFTHHYYRIPEQSFTLWLWGDVHAGVESHDTERFNWFLKKAQQSENPYYLGMGDYCDFAAFGDDRKITQGGLHETTSERINRMVKEDTDTFAKRIEIMRGRLIGLVGGNHQATMIDGRTSDQYLAELLDTKYLGWLSVIDIGFGKVRGKSGKQHHVRLFVCHGKAGGKLLGTSLNSVVDMASVVINADIFAMGHDHQRMAVPKSVLEFKFSPFNDTGFTLQQKRQYFVRSGSFQKSYVKDTSGFAQGRLMKPADLGAVRLYISTHRIRTEGVDEVRLDIEGVV